MNKKVLLIILLFITLNIFIQVAINKSNSLKVDESLLTQEVKSIGKDITKYNKDSKDILKSLKSTKTPTKKTKENKKNNCPKNYKLVNNKCILETNTLERCPKNSYSYNNYCIVAKSVNKSCSYKTITFKNGYSENVKGYLYNNTCYYGEIATNKEECLNNNYIYLSSINKCYVSTGNIDTICNDISITNNKNIPNGCYKKTSKEKYCPNGYNLENNKCIKKKNRN